jgi:hypothetical protein
MTMSLEGLRVIDLSTHLSGPYCSMLLGDMGADVVKVERPEGDDIRHNRRELVHVGVTDQPTAAWAAQQIVHAFPHETGPAYLLRDRDAIYGADFQRRVERMGIRQIVIAPRAPWQNPFGRARHRLDSPRLPRSRPRAQRTPPASLASLLPRVRQRHAASPESR